MKNWWLRPAVRIGAALVLPFAVPAIITCLIWALPGDPASIICPPEVCQATDSLAARWNLDRGPMSFFSGWLSAALRGDLGSSWRLQQGVPVRELVETAVPTTALLVGLGLLPMVIGALVGALGWIGARWDGLLQISGLVPALVLALVVAAAVELTYGAASLSGPGSTLRLLGGALVLGVADGAFSSVVVGCRSLFATENKRRYVTVARLRGERAIDNTLPNVAPALAGQLRARILHLLSGAVVVEVILRIDGLGDLLWGGTLLQDFGVVLAAATGFAVASALLLLLQALVEISVAIHVRRSPDMGGFRPGEVA